MNPQVIPWQDPPMMNYGAPLPALQLKGSSLFVSYVCHNPAFPGWDSGADIDHPGFDLYSAVLRFDGIIWHHFGAPNIDGVLKHPFGLNGQGFWQVLNSSRLPKDNSCHHWIVTFHDETLEVAAGSAVVLSMRENGEDTHSIVRGYAE